MPIEMNLQPLSTTCHISGEPFAEGDRVVSHLVRGDSIEIERYDVAEAQLDEFTLEGTTVCRWVHVYKPKVAGENPDRELKMTADNLFVTLADPANELNEETTRLLQFLALMLERKRVLRPKGQTADASVQIYEHAKTKERYEVPTGDLDPAFFLAVQQQLSVLVGAPTETESSVPEQKEPQLN